MGVVSNVLDAWYDGEIRCSCSTLTPDIMVESISYVQPSRGNMVDTEYQKLSCSGRNINFEMYRHD